MEIRPAVYKKVTVEQRRCVKEAVYGCDHCGEEIPDYPNETSKLEITIFQQNSESERKHFCSWKCTLEYLPNVHSDYFFTLPMVYCDQGKKGIKELIEYLEDLRA